MILKIVVTSWAMMLVGASWNFKSCTPRHSNRESLMWHSVPYCKVPASEITSQTWYQDEAVLKVIDGTFTVELLDNDISPRSLNVEGKRIVELMRGFARISSLERFSLEDNLIERIEGFVFEDLPDLIHLNLARNRIEYLEEDSFQGLGKLEILNLDYNSLNVLSGSINDDILPKLTHLYLRHNRLGRDPAYNSKIRVPQLHHSTLKHLYLSNNSISSLSEGDLFGLNNLTHLFLEDNKLDGFPVEKMPLLRVLSLDGNNINLIPAITPQLKFLSLARNNIRRITTFVNAENLLVLVLSYNRIVSALDAGTFQNLSSLQHLVLDHNFITESMPLKYFYNLTCLRSLDLTSNNIDSHVSPKQFAHLPALRELYLANNSLTSFPGNESFRESKLSYLDLSHNKVSKMSHLELNAIPKLKVLKLTGNPLKRVDPYSVPGHLTILF